MTSLYPTQTAAFSLGKPSNGWNQVLRNLVAVTIVAAAVGAAVAEDGVTKDEILVGATSTKTGAIAVCGNVDEGASAYFKRINDTGGVNGRKIKFIVLDDGYSPQRAIGNVRRLMGQDKVFALISGCGTVTGAAVLSIAERDTIPYLFPLVGLDDLVLPTKRNVFSILPQYGSQVVTMIDYVAKSQSPKTAAVSIINIAGHENWMKAVRAKLEALKITIVDEQVIDVAASDKAPFVTRVKSKNPDLFVMVDSAPGSARYILEMQRQNWKPKVITGINTLTDESFLRAVGTAGDNLVIAPGVLLPTSDPRSNECVDAVSGYDKGLNPSGYTSFGCLGAKLFVDAVRRVGADLTRERLIAELENTRNFQSGFSGPITFGPGVRQGLSTIYPVGLQDGKFKVLGVGIPLQ